MFMPWCPSGSISPWKGEKPDVAVPRAGREVTVQLAGGDRGVLEPTLHRVPQPLQGHAAQPSPALRTPVDLIELP